jgi:hypothetical protein
MHANNYRHVPAELPKAIQAQNLEIDFSGNYSVGVNLDDFLSVAKNWITERPITRLFLVMPLVGPHNRTYLSLNLPIILGKANSTLWVQGEKKIVQSRSMFCSKDQKVDMWVWQTDRQKFLTWRGV